MSYAVHNCTDDQLVALVRHLMQMYPDERVYWLGVGDEALARPAAPYTSYCRRLLGELHHTLQRDGAVLP